MGTRDDGKDTWPFSDTCRPMNAEELRSSAIKHISSAFDVPEAMIDTEPHAVRGGIQYVPPRTKEEKTFYGHFYRVRGMTGREISVYQELVARGVSPEDARQDALDGVSIEEVRKMKGTDMNRQQRLDMAQRTLERAQEQIDKLLNRKNEPRGKKRNVIFYRKTFDNGITYTYAAVRAKGLWYTTGPKSPKGFTWDELLDWLGDDVKIWVPIGWEELK